LALHKQCERTKRRLILCNIDPQIKEVFIMTNLHKLLSICDTEQEALAAFRKKGWFGRS
jgi:anti-anti-sigma regulatory factor